jgi:hypothetical protein
VYWHATIILKNRDQHFTLQLSKIETNIARIKIIKKNKKKISRFKGLLRIRLRAGECLQQSDASSSSIMEEIKV